ncbi:MAG: isoprenylcysteine carboxylmethyltransferase family protein [Xanthomonadales bacterium]|nr:isoprenylcysteine carboxylmethyltransferase family protein [Xanthomonadales bacterium]
MVSNRAEKMGERAGVAGFFDSLRFNEIARQGLGLLLLLVCAVFTEAAGEDRIYLGFALALIGQVWRIYAAGVIYKNKQLATTGAYSLVRHPLYLGNFLILVGFTIACSNWIVVLIVLFFFWFYYPAAIKYEDTKLERIFEDQWRAWSANTPAMFPTRLAWKGNANAEWNARQSLLRNGELIISVYIVICAAVLLYRAGMF